jgi:SWI/SNF-related matrix-associated actin-dependent regulator 1 of chromatin subfamily A
LLPEQLEDVVGSRRKDAFLEHFCVVRDDGRIIGAKRVNELAALLRPYVLRRTLDDVAIQLPPLRWADVLVEPDDLLPKPEMSGEELQVVQSAETKLRDGEALTPADLMDLATLRRWTGIAKAQAVADLLSEEAERIVCFAIHREVIDMIQNVLGDAAAVTDGRTTPEQRQRAIDGFQGRIPGCTPRILICQLAIAATALTLTAAAHVVFAESSWVPAEMAQAAARCHRIGQSRPVLARTVSLKGSIDEIVNATLRRKLSVIASVTLSLSTEAA